MLHKLQFLFISVFIVAIYTRASAASVNSSQSGNWATGTTWVSGATPVSGTDYVILSGHTVTIDAAGAVGRTVTVSSGGTLIISGAGGATFGRSLKVDGTLTVSTSGEVSIGSTGTTGTTYGFDMTTLAGSATLTSGTITIRGQLQVGSSTIASSLTINGATVNIDPQFIAGSANAFVVGSAATLTFSAGTVTLINPVTAQLAGGKEISFGQYSSVLGSASIILGQGVSTIASAQGYRISCNALAQLQNLTVNTGNVAVNLITNVSIKGVLTLTSGNLSLGAYNMTLLNPISGTPANLSAGSTSSITIGGTEAGINIPSGITALNNLTLNNSNGTTLQGNMTINGILSLTSGNLSLGAYNMTLLNPISGTPANLSAGSTSSITIGGTEAGINIPSGITALNNLTLNNSNGTTLQGNMTINGILTMTSGAISLNGQTLTLGNSTSAGSLVNTSGYMTGSGTFKRWFGTTLISGTAGAFPLGVGTNNRSVAIGGTPTAGGTVSVSYIDASTSSQFSSSFEENSQTFVNRYDANWTIAVADGFTSADATLAINGNGIPGISSIADINISGATVAAPGTYAAPTGDITAPVVNRTGLTEATLPSTYYIASTSGSSMPVELTSFTVKTASKSVSLNWATATEVNNSGFEVERRTTVHSALVSGTIQSNSSAWTKIGFVEGHGTTNAPQSYCFTDASASGTVSYRLKQVDRNGKFEYSKEVEAVVALVASDYGLGQNYPNPFNPSTTFSFAVRTLQHVSLKVYNMVGQEVCSLFEGMANADEMYTVKFDAKDFASGIYMSVLTTSDKREVRKMMLMK